MTTKATLLAGLLSLLVGCTPSGPGGEQVFDPNFVPVLRPVSAFAAVQSGNTFFFPGGRDPDFGVLLNTCAVAIPTLQNVLANQQNLDDELPIQSLIGNFQSPTNDDFFSIQIQDDGFVSWGLFVEGPVEGRPDALGKEWANRSGGTLTTNCDLVEALGVNAVVNCFASWRGEATENFTLEDADNAQVEVACLYALSRLCQTICDDDNSCTFEACIQGQGCVYENRSQGSPCGIDLGAAGGGGADSSQSRIRVGRCNADAECVPD